MSKTSSISIFVSLFEPLESSGFLNCHKNIKGINKETLQRKKTSISQTSLKHKEITTISRLQITTKVYESLHYMVQSLCT